MSSSPVFVCVFGDGETTRMTVWHAPDRQSLDLARGIKLAQWAYRSRMKQEPLAIIKARFERDGSVLEQYDAEQLAKVMLP